MALVAGVFAVMLQLMLLLLSVASVRTYDEFSTCVRPGRTAKAWPEPPCDFRNQAWCTAPGSAYPWHAVRRFVHENQGLMRRMYGDMRQISVLRAEFESNDVLYPGDGVDFQLIRDGVTKRYRPTEVTPASTLGSTVSSRARPSTTTTTSTTVRVSASPTSTSPSPSSSSATLTSPPTGSTTESTSEDEATEVPSTLGSTSSRPGGDTTFGETSTFGVTPVTGGETTIQERDKGLTTVLEGLEQVTELETSLAEAEDQLAEESEMEYEEEEEEEEETPEPQKPRRGINACPVKEEVVAPFWANNTRGEILALLNLYPFEQYVHWEKCTDEHQQMFCRDGCRCEQQYRLHRLLAYDPRNECRGIFSDWFKFPSCCVCKCYDIPPEFRLTSRSPRRGGLTKLKGKKGSPGKGAQPRVDDGETVINKALLNTRVVENGEISEGLKAEIHQSLPPRNGRGYPETATIGTVDAATPHFYYQPPSGIMQLSRHPRDLYN